MKTMDWRALAIDDGILTEPTADGNRLILWLRGDRDPSFQHWERITSVVHADVKVERGLCSTEATSIPARKAVGGGLATLWRRVVPPKGHRVLRLPNGESVEQCGERQAGLILVWAEDSADILDEDRLKSRWPEGQRFQKLGQNLFLISGIEAKAAKPSEVPPTASSTSPTPTQPREQAERLLAVARQTGDRGKVASALTDLGVTIFNEGDARKALALLEEALTLTRQAGNRAEESDVLGNLGMAALAVNQLPRARQIFEQELEYARATRNHLAEKTTLERLAITVGRMGDHIGAIALFERALPLARLVGDRQQEANLLWFQSIHHATLGQRDIAIAKAEESIAVFKLMGKPQAAWYGAQLQKYRMGGVEYAPAGPIPKGGAPNSPHDYLGGSIAAHAMAGQPNEGPGQAQAQAQAKPISGPGLLAMAMSATKSMATFIGSGFKTVTPEIQRKRLETCAGCEHHTGMRCKVCGCFTAVKSGLLHEDCPIGKWPA